MRGLRGWVQGAGLALGAALLAGCGAVQVNVTVHNRTERDVQVEVARDDGSAAFALAPVLPGGRLRSSFRARRGERFVVHADRRPVGTRRIEEDDLDPVVWELDVR